MSRMMKRVSEAGKVDPGDRVTLPMKFGGKPELSSGAPKEKIVQNHLNIALLNVF